MTDINSLKRILKLKNEIDFLIKILGRKNKQFLVLHSLKDLDESFDCRMEKSGRSRMAHNHEILGSNPSSATNMRS